MQGPQRVLFLDKQTLTRLPGPSLVETPRLAANHSLLCAVSNQTLAIFDYSPPIDSWL